ncbi:unnamed protein product [marine sediment metagenome]|uniref:Uncharacterized protein n=1 Tax=marine sediment metagenome TaxID=412755 RepID=X0W1S4_9ZZZZ
MIRLVYRVQQRNVTTWAVSISYGIAGLLSAYGLLAILELPKAS